ncbi:integral membrane [Fusarium longipes]|uniref:Integral membrane n=1 Tax=Fusarium longipes TaxID=694270 RepID=A0A395SYJ5_9HYPO|nr:integral membrane [Fusarium longipes]
MSLKSDIICAVVVTWVAALLAQIARVFARRMTKVQWWWDDYFCLGAFIVGIGYNVVMIYCNYPPTRVTVDQVANWIELGTETWYLGTTIPETVSDVEYENINLNARLMQFLISMTYSYSIGFSKLSILLFYWRIFKQSAIRIPIQVLLGLSVAWLILRTFMVTFHCIPVQAYWDKSIEGAVCKINDSQFFFGTCLTHFALDIVILALPIIEVFKLRLRMGQKVAITALFVIGFIVCLASTFVVVESIRYDVNTTQMPRDMARNDMWGVVEINIAIVSGICPRHISYMLMLTTAGCFPLLRPIFTKILPKRFLSSAGSSHPISRTTNAIRLTTINRTIKEREADDNSSTQELADPERGGIHADFEIIDNKEGPRTYISSRNTESLHSSEQDATGIYVRNEVVQEIEESNHTYTMKR